MNEAAAPSLPQFAVCAQNSTIIVNAVILASLFTQFFERELVYLEKTPAYATEEISAESICAD